LNRQDTYAECFFLDVGQGTSQVILLKGGRAIVIDGGPDRDARIPLSILGSAGVHTLEALIVSHNDADHENGAVRILETYKYSTEKLYFLVDRFGIAVPTCVRANEIDGARSAKGLKPLNRIRLEADGNDAREIYKSTDENLRLDLLHPNFKANDRWKNEPNATCGVLRLSCGKEPTARRILFSGDVPVKVWRWIEQTRVVSLPMHCDVMTVSHHGGNTGSKDELQWLYNEAVRCKHAVVSVGTQNPYGHPTEEGITSIRDARARVKSILCTQLTERCCDNPVKTFPAGLTTPHRRSQSHPEQNPDGRHIACAGTVIARIGLNDVEIIKPTGHRDAVKSLETKPYGHPLCLVPSRS